MTTTTIIQEEMLKYFSQLNKKEQQSVLGFVKTFLNSRNEMMPQIFEEYNEELEHGNAEIEAGNDISHDEVEKNVFKIEYASNNR